MQGYRFAERIKLLRLVECGTMTLRSASSPHVAPRAVLRWRVCSDFPVLASASVVKRLPFIGTTPPAGAVLRPASRAQKAVLTGTAFCTGRAACCARPNHAFPRDSKPVGDCCHLSPVPAFATDCQASSEAIVPTPASVTDCLTSSETIVPTPASARVSASRRLGWPARKQ
jgi:hypothetical protein